MATFELDGSRRLKVKLDRVTVLGGERRLGVAPPRWLAVFR